MSNLIDLQDEVLFQHLPEVTAPANDDDAEMAYVERLRRFIDDAENFDTSFLQPLREENTKYYHGLEPALASSSDDDDDDEDPGQSTIITTDTRDTVLSIMPSLLRIFATREDVVTFIPTREDMADKADEASEYVSYIVWDENDGFVNFDTVFQDALIRRLGILKWEVVFDGPKETRQYTDVDEYMFMALLVEHPEAEILDFEPDEQQGLLSSITIRIGQTSPMVKVEAVPTDEFRISPQAKNARSAPLVGHERVVSVSELVERGYPYDLVDEYRGASNKFSYERQMRNPGDDPYHHPRDGVLFGQWYVRIDKDGDGVDELRYIETIGDTRDIIEDTYASQVRFALFTPQMEAHTAVGLSTVDLVKDLQKFKTNMSRGMLDSLAAALRSKTVYNETLTNTDDVLSAQIDGVIRTKGDPNAAVAFHSHPFVGEQILPAINYIDALRASRTGITEASKGLDPDAMQSTNLVGINAIMSGAQERIEMIARIFAETGFRDLYKGILRDITQFPSEEKVVEVRGKWVHVDPSLYDPNMRMRVNPTLGKGNDVQRLATLQMVLEKQELIMTRFGVANPIVTPMEYRNTIEDMLKLSNMRNTSRYFKQIDPATMDAIMNAPKEPDPTELLARAEMEKVRSQTAQAISKKQIDEDRIILDDDFRRDKLNVDTAVKLAQIQSSDRQAELQAMNRAPNGSGQNRRAGGASAGSSQ